MSPDYQTFNRGFIDATYGQYYKRKLLTQCQSSFFVSGTSRTTLSLFETERKTVTLTREV